MPLERLPPLRLERQSGSVRVSVCARLQCAHESRPKYIGKLQENMGGLVKICEAEGKTLEFQAANIGKTSEA